MSEANVAERTPPSGSEVDLFALFKIVWDGKWRIAVTAAIFVLVAATVSLSLPNKYRAVALLAPASSEGMGSLAGMARQFGGLASLAGISLGSGGNGGVDKTMLTLEVLQSRAFIADFVRRHELLVPLMAAKSWDMENRAWVIDDDKYDVANQQWLRKVSPPFQAEPSDWEVYDEFSRHVLGVSRAVKTGMIKISIELMSPDAARQWVQWLTEDVNQAMRERDIAEARDSIEYLQEQLQETSIAEMQQIFYELIEEQTKSMMLAQVQQEYVLKIIDPAVVPELKVSPRRMVICLLAGMTGLLIGLLWVLVSHLAVRQR